MSDSTVYEVEYRWHTDAAMLVVWGTTDVWLPLSQIDFHEPLTSLEQGDVIEVEVPDWLAEKKFC